MWGNVTRSILAKEFDFIHWQIQSVLVPIGLSLLFKYLSDQLNLPLEICLPFCPTSTSILFTDAVKQYLQHFIVLRDYTCIMRSSVWKMTKVAR